MGIIIPGGASHVPTEIQERLKQIDPRLYIQPKERVVFDCGAGGDTSERQWVWYVVVKWPENDPRWRMVKFGMVDPEDAFDMIGEIPADCPLEQVPGYLARQLRTSNGVARKICEEVAAWNKDQQVRNGEVTSEFAQELFEANASGLFEQMGKSNPKPVFQHNPAQKTGRKNRPKEA